MLRDAETTSIAERMRRSPVGGDALSRRRGGGLDSWARVEDITFRAVRYAVYRRKRPFAAAP
jgi:hypothetical protein